MTGRIRTGKNNIVYGVGVNDALYCVTKTITECGKRKQLWICPFYSKWQGMLERCYSAKLQTRYPSYIGCTVCEQWLLFSNFKAWMETQDWENKELDKDLLSKNNKVYSPESCVFITHAINSFILDKRSNAGLYPIGVHYDARDRKFVTQIRNPFSKKREKSSGFDSPEVAHKAWLTRKLELATILAESEKDSRIAEALISRYTNYDQ